MLTKSAHTLASVLALIEEIAAEPSKNAKIELVKSAMHEEGSLFAKVLTYAYDPFYIYGVDEITLNAIPFVKGTVTPDDGTLFFQLLDALRSRTLTGGRAIAAIGKVMNDHMDGDCVTLLRRVLLKDMRAGFGVSTINKAVPGTLPEFPYMRCSLPKDSDIDNWDWSVGIISQLKADGMFMNVNRLDDFVSVTSRQGTPFDLGALGTFAIAAKTVFPENTQTHGEMLVVVNGKPLPRATGNGILNALADGTGMLEPGQSLMFQAWDQIPMASVVKKGECLVPYKERLRVLAIQVSVGSMISLVPTRIVKSRKEGYQHFAEMLRAGYEGVVWKRPDMPWKDGTSKDQVKGKMSFTVELRVKGFNEGTGKNVGMLGSFQCESEDGLLKTNVNGRDAKMRKAIWADQAGWMDAVVSITANMILEVSESSDVCSLFLPVFEERRMDKAVADTLPQIRDQFQATIDGVV